LFDSLPEFNFDSGVPSELRNYMPMVASPSQKLLKRPTLRKVTQAFNLGHVGGKKNIIKKAERIVENITENITENVITEDNDTEKKTETITETITEFFDIESNTEVNTDNNTDNNTEVNTEANTEVNTQEEVKEIIPLKKSVSSGGNFKRSCKHINLTSRS
jgi:hypothetical protein